MSASGATGRSLRARIVEMVLGSRATRREWRDYTRRAKALPPDYRMVMAKIQKFLWEVGDAVDEQSYRVLYDICEVFEDAAAAGRPVLAVTGDDVAAFALNMLAARQATTWAGQKADRLNADVHARLKTDEDR